ncbi:chlorophyllase [Sphingomonas sp. NFR15]|uniref:alpha/beta hydrolase family protein n=1 Tax=Sphingomonas sp. NFR15 TaxID=1566282 RepID=UPI0008858B86|nr:chlorophyllase [Sphingomonas sp. NFR15]SDA35825.1 Alpha/beta hydrolase family protein [Sphingomonas sp. NFR15]
MTEHAIWRDANMSLPTPVLSVRGIRLSSPGRGEHLQLRVSAPVTGGDLPVILFSHGYGSSMDGYAPLADYWAAHGFVVIQPTHLDAKRLGLAQDDLRRPSIWRNRVEDMKRILDALVPIARSAPGLEGRVDYSLVGAAGHSFGGQTTSMLLGARMLGPDGEAEDMSDRRVKVGILLASGGRGGADLSPLGREVTPYLNSDFDHMTTPALVVAGDADHSPLTTRGPDWFADPYRLSPGKGALLTLFGGEHMLGGISGYEVTETSDENPARVAVIQRMTTAYLCSTLLDDAAAWPSACDALAAEDAPLGDVEGVAEA